MASFASAILLEPIGLCKKKRRRDGSKSKGALCLVYAAMKTLRLLMPQWQGASYNFPPDSSVIYPLGARLLAFLAPQSDSPLIEVPLQTTPVTATEAVAAAEAQATTGATSPSAGASTPVVAHEAVLAQLQAATAIINQEAPERIVVFGGDCLVDQAPFAYLNERYPDDFGVLWIDAHPDISTPDMHNHAHAMVLGNLLGQGDPLLAQEVKRKLKPEQVAMAGINSFNSPVEEKVVQDLVERGLTLCSGDDILQGSDKVLSWLKKQQIKHLAIHLDLDVLDPQVFHAIYPHNPGHYNGGTAWGKLDFASIARLLKDIEDAHTAIVGLGIAEHLPWDAYQLQQFMGSLSIMR